MPYDDDDDDLFGEEFDFVDDDDEESSTEDSEVEAEEKAGPKGRKPAPGKGKPAGALRLRGKGPSPSGGRDGRRDADAAVPSDAASELGDRLPPEDSLASDDAPAAPAGPPADHCVHIYEYGKLKRTIPRKFTDEEAVSFAEEYTRTGKAYGRYAIATPDDEEPAEEFADAAKG